MNIQVDIITNDELMQHPWPHRSRREDGDGLGTCAECHLAHCPRQPYAGQQMVKRDVVVQKKHGDEQW